MNTCAQNQVLSWLGTKIDRIVAQKSITYKKLDSLPIEVKKLYVSLEFKITKLGSELKDLINQGIMVQNLIPKKKRSQG